MLYVVGGTVTSAALENVRQEGFINNRTGVPMIAVVITDGLSRRPSLTRFQASLLRREGVQVYAIGIYDNSSLYISVWSTLLVRKVRTSNVPPTLKKDYSTCPRVKDVPFRSFDIACPVLIFQ